MRFKMVAIFSEKNTLPATTGYALFFAMSPLFYTSHESPKKRNQYIIYNRQQNLAYSTMNAIQLFEENYLSNNTVVLYVIFFFRKKKPLNNKMASDVNSGIRVYICSTETKIQHTYVVNKLLGNLLFLQ